MTVEGAMAAVKLFSALSQLRQIFTCVDLNLTVVEVNAGRDSKRVVIAIQLYEQQ